MQRYECRPTFILSTGIKDEGFVHSLPVDMTTKQVLADKKKKNDWTKFILSYLKYKISL